jgi:hypothetical protein
MVMGLRPAASLAIFPCASGYSRELSGPKKVLRKARLHLLAVGATEVATRCRFLAQKTPQRRRFEGDRRRFQGDRRRFEGDR